MGMGVSSEMVAICGMILGILAGISFMATSEGIYSSLFWMLGAVGCLLRAACIQLDNILKHPGRHHDPDDIFFEELPERVSDAVTLVGFGFAIDSSPWLGLAAALGAIFSAYVRSFGISKGAGKIATSTGPMTRIHRLTLVMITATLMAIGVSLGDFRLTIPQAALWIIVTGCIATILMRWTRIRKF